MGTSISAPDRGAKLSTFVIALFVLVGTLIPFFLCVFNLVRNLSTSSDITNLLFYKLLFQTLLFCLTQAFCSSVLACLMGAFLGLWFFFNLCRLSRRAQKVAVWVLENVSYYFYFLPGLSMAFLLMECAKLSRWIPSQGFLAILLAQSLFFVPLLSAYIFFRLSNFWSVQGKERWETFQLVGASRSQLIFNTFKDAIAEEWKLFFPTVFFMALNSFTVLLILGDGPGQGSLETFLYYSASHFSDSFRLLLLMGSQLLLSSCGLYFFQKKHESSLQIQGQASIMLDQVFNTPFSFSEIGNGFQVGGWFLVSAAALVLGVLFKQFYLSADDFRAALPFFRFSFFVALSAACLTSLLFFLVLWSSSRWRRTFAFGIGTTPVLLATFWIYSGQEHFFSGPVGVIFGMSLLWVFWSSFWIDLQFKTLDVEILDSAFLCGAEGFAYIRHILWPLFRPLWARVTMLCFMAVIGDVCLTSLLDPEGDWLSLWSRREAAHFHFSGQSVLLWTNLIALVIFAWMQKRKVSHVSAY